MIKKTGNTYKMLMIRGFRADGGKVWFPPERIIDAQDSSRTEDFTVRYDAGEGKVREARVAYHEMTQYMADLWRDDIELKPGK